MSNTTKATAKITCPLTVEGKPVYDAKDNTVIISTMLDCGNVSGSIGTWLDTINAGSEIRVFGQIIEMPKAGTFSARFNAVLTRLIGAAFTGCDDSEVPKNEDGKSFIEGLQASKKLHFADCRKVSVLRGLKIRVDNYREGLKTLKNATDSIKENQVLISQTGTFRKVNKAFKEGGKPAVEKLLAEMKGTKVIGWNA